MFKTVDLGQVLADAHKTIALGGGAAQITWGKKFEASQANMVKPSFY